MNSGQSTDGTSARPQRGDAAPLCVFVSHSSVDDAFGHRLAADLRRALGGDESGVWYDSAGGLQGGDTWWRKIVAELSARPVFIVVLSPDAMTSQWVHDEIDLAWQQKNQPPGKLIVPVLYRPCAVREDLKSMQMVSFVAPRPYEAAFTELVDAINHSDIVRNPVVEHPERLLAGADELIRQGRPAEAILPLERATHLAPESAAAWYALANAYSRSGRPIDALAAVDHALQRDATSAKTWLLRGVIGIALGRDADALAALDRALTLNPDSADAWCNKAVVLFRQERDHDAVQACDRALGINPNMGYAWRVKADALHALGRQAESADARRTADRLGA